MLVVCDDLFYCGDIFIWHYVWWTNDNFIRRLQSTRIKILLKWSVLVQKEQPKLNKAHTPVSKHQFGKQFIPCAKISILEIPVKFILTSLFHCFFENVVIKHASCTGVSHPVLRAGTTAPCTQICSWPADALATLMPPCWRSKGTAASPLPIWYGCCNAQS